MSTTIKDKETMDKIAKYTEKTLPIFDLFNMEYINLNESFFTPSGENWLIDGKTYFKFDKGKIPTETLDIIYDEVSKNYIMGELKSDDEFCIMYDTTDSLANGMENETKGGITCFAIRRNGEIFIESNTIGSILMYMDVLKHPKLVETKSKVSEFARKCYNWIKEQIRNTLVVDVQGDFYIDNIIEDTYYQRRYLCNDSNNSVDYVVYNWCSRMANKEPIEWANVMEMEKLYVAIN